MGTKDKVLLSLYHLKQALQGLTSLGVVSSEGCDCVVRYGAGSLDIGTLSARADVNHQNGRQQSTALHGAA